MWMRLCTVIILAVCSGCAALGGRNTDVQFPPELVDGQAAFGRTIPAADPIDLLSVTPAMREFVAEDVGTAAYSYARFRRLMRKMVATGFFINQYDRTATYSAAKTFDTRKGNCIAYTNLFVALAREADQQASYQVVHGQPSWNVESGYLVRNNHVNVHLRGIRVPGEFGSELTVDFNEIEPEDDARTELISDAYAASMFYGNLSVQHLHDNDPVQAFAYLKRGIETEPSNIDLWNNLGSLYSVLEKDALAEQAYQVARSIDARDKTAISGLVKVLHKQGRAEEAEGYQRLVMRYQNRNPYYQYALAEQAYHNDDFDRALVLVNQAIQLKRNNARFYALRAATAQKLGDDELVEQSLRLQRKWARDGAETAYFTVSEN